MAHTQYPNPPIVEAIVELRFSEQIRRDELVAALATALGERYCGERQQQIQVTVQAILHAETIGSTVGHAPSAELMRTPDGLRLVGCTNAGFSVHALAPYPGWAHFMRDLDAVFEALLPQFGERKLHEVLVRYIDRVVLPPLPVDLEDYLRILPPLPETGPAHVAGVSVNLHRTDGAGLETLLTLRTESAAGEPRPAVVLDFIARQVLSAPCRLADRDIWLPAVENLHNLQYDSFEACITPACRELFQ
jgi:uncharacterized protein (TIGR04255 family)